VVDGLLFKVWRYYIFQLFRHHFLIVRILDLLFGNNYEEITFKDYYFVSSLTFRHKQDLNYNSPVIDVNNPNTFLRTKLHNEIIQIGF